MIDATFFPATCRAAAFSAALLLAILVVLALAPFILPGTRALDVAAKVCVFILLVASYDLLLGYTGIVSFAHTMFFGIGAYGIAHSAGAPRGRLGRDRPRHGRRARAVARCCRSLIGLFSLRVKAIFFAMITLAVASFFAILASQLSNITGGEDGITFKVPELMRSRTAAYYLVFGAALALFLLLLRVVNSPFGRVLLAIRENDFRAEALGYRTVVYRTIANCLGALVATLAGVLYALWLRYAGPNTTLDFGIMIDILLMVVIGGMGTMYGAVIGATIFVVAQNYLQEAMKAFSASMKGVPLLPNLFHPDRWLLWLGVLFVLSVYYFPHGIVGQLRARLREMNCSSHYLACEGREIHYTEWGAGNARTRDRLARPGAHRPGHGRYRGAPVGEVPRHLPGHDRPRVVAVEPGAGEGVLPGVLRAARRLADRPARHPTNCPGSALRWAARSASGWQPAR